MRWLIAFLFVPLTGFADPVEVDVELVLAVDVSRSMSAEELDIQRRGYAAALSSAEVMGAIRGGLLGRIAVTYVEWAGDSAQRVIVPWTMIETQAEADAVAWMILSQTAPGMRRTSISGALLYAAEDMDANAFAGLRRVIDVSCDGPNNKGLPVLAAREAVLARGITINGLPLMTRDDFSSLFGIEDLDAYYEACVIGGPGAFVIPVRDWSEFAGAVRRKLVLEIAGLPPRIWAAQYRPAPAYDCLIGEKLWERNRGFFGVP
ncbi:MAG: DUF1194 domain-containing protein [Proteobacteria bacterium]|nr:DUF1194 domain-containing protein [Pseudomonadota bacterium]